MKIKVCCPPKAADGDTIMVRIPPYWGEKVLMLIAQEFIPYFTRHRNGC
jgi:hypothetical protein